LTITKQRVKHARRGTSPPPYDGPSRLTALLEANIGLGESLTFVALQRRDRTERAVR
jgi:hypothetical protein